MADKTTQQLNVGSSYSILRELVALREYKDANKKDDHYRQRAGKAWSNAKARVEAGPEGPGATITHRPDLGRDQRVESGGDMQYNLVLRLDERTILVGLLKTSWAGKGDDPNAEAKGSMLAKLGA